MRMSQPRLLREQCRGEVLVDDRLDAAQAAVLLADDRDAAAAGGDDDVARLDEGADGAEVEDLAGFRRGDDSPPALVAAVLPLLTVVDHLLGLVGRQVATDRLGGRLEVGVVGCDPGAGDEGRNRTGDTATGERGLERVEDGEADRPLRLRAAPVERHRRDDVGGDLVLDEQVAHLGSVAVGEHDLVAGPDEARRRAASPR